MKNALIGGLVVLVAVLGFMLVTGDDAGESDNTATDNQTTTQSSAANTESLANQGIESIPTEYFENKTKVTVLDVSGNNLTGALPAEIRKMTNLVTLDASDNNLTGIPAEIGQLSKLKSADFSNNDISGLPLELGNLTQLETLDLRGNPNVSTVDLDKIKLKLTNTNILTD